MELFNLESEKILQKEKDERTHLFLWWPSSWPLAHHTHLHMTPHGSSRKQSLFRQKCPKHTLPFLFHCSSFSSSCSWVAGSVLQPSILWLICLWPLDYSIIRLPFLHVGSLCPWVQISAISQFPVKDFLCQLRPSEPSCSGRPQNLCQEIEIGQFILIIFSEEYAVIM